MNIEPCHPWPRGIGERRPITLDRCQDEEPIFGQALQTQDDSWGLSRVSLVVCAIMLFFIYVFPCFHEFFKCLFVSIKWCCMSVLRQILMILASTSHIQTLHKQGINSNSLINFLQNLAASLHCREDNLICHISNPVKFKPIIQIY